MPDEKTYRELLLEAWKGSRGMGEPESPPAKFSIGFYAGLLYAARYIERDRDRDGVDIMKRLNTIRGRRSS